MGGWGAGGAHLSEGTAIRELNFLELALPRMQNLLYQDAPEEVLLQLLLELDQKGRYKLSKPSK
jgi:hypothetical protein